MTLHELKLTAKRSEGVKIISKVVKYKNGTIWFMYSDSDFAVYYSSIDSLINRIVSNQVDVRLTAL